jgi:hypothetical protein
MTKNKVLNDAGPKDTLKSLRLELSHASSEMCKIKAVLGMSFQVSCHPGWVDEKIDFCSVFDLLKDMANRVEISLERMDSLGRTLGDSINGGGA